MTKLGHSPVVSCETCPDVAQLDELRSAIISLYKDQIRPTQADISRRLTEMGYAGLDLSSMMAIAASSDFEMVLDDGVSICFEFKRPPGWFRGWIDPIDQSLAYSIELWDLFSHYIGHGCRRDYSSEESGLKFYQIKGGRYGLAKKLSEMSPIDYCVECECFRFQISKFSVGRIAHFVQQAISRGILRYEDNLLQPSLCCKALSAALAAKLLAADPACLRTLPRTPVTLITREVESVHQLQLLLSQMLAHEPQIPLSQLKKKLIQEYKIVVNPIKFGHTKLSDLLKQVAHVKLVYGPQNNSYIQRA